MANKRLSNIEYIILKIICVGGITFPDVKPYYIASLIKIVRYWWSDRHIDQWNRIGRPKIEPHKYNKLTFDKGSKSNSNGGGIAFFF